MDAKADDRKFLSWIKSPEKLDIWEWTHTRCGEWRAVRISSGVIYTQWRFIPMRDDWEPFFSVLG